MLSLSLVLPRVLVAAGGLVAAGCRAVMEGGSAGWSTIPTGVLCASTRAGGNTSCAFSAGEKAGRGMSTGFSPALTGRNQ